MRNWIFVLLLLISINASSQQLYSKLIGINDTSIHEFTDINRLYFLHQDNNKRLKKLVTKVVNASTKIQARKALFNIASTPSELNNILASFDYYFKNTKSIAGSNVEKFVQVIQENKDVYYIINKKNNFKIDTTLQIDSLINKVQQKISWQYGNGAYTFTTMQDSIHIATMKKYNANSLDKAVIKIIEKHLLEQTSMFKYDYEAILQEVIGLPNVKDAIWDVYLIKLAMLPNYDNLGVVFVLGKDTVERIYNLQIGRINNIKLGKYILIPMKMSNEVWFRKAMYGLHWVHTTRKQSIINMTK